MKLVSMVIVLAVALAGLGVACGPEETYCYDQHKSCKQAQLDRDKAAADKEAADREAARDGGAD
ncbi:MAG: hypothetical protein ABI560_11735 [Myxococcales bacterium]